MAYIAVGAHSNIPKVTASEDEKKKDLCQVWLDMKKAFDSLDHWWIINACKKSPDKSTGGGYNQEAHGPEADNPQVNGRRSRGVSGRSGIFRQLTVPFAMHNRINSIPSNLGKRPQGIPQWRVDDLCENRSPRESTSALIQEIVCKSRSPAQCAVAVVTK